MRIRRASVISAVIWIVCSAAVAVSQTAGEGDGLVASRTAPPAQQAQTASAVSALIDPVNGSTPEDVVRYAFEHNGDLAAAREMINEARGRTRQAALRPNPMVEASFGRTVGKDNNLVLGASLPLELNGRRRARVSVADAELEMREAEVADLERRLAAEVRNKYTEAIAAARNLKFIEDLVTLTRDSHRLVQARVDRGKTAPLEQNVVFVELNRVDAMRIGLESRAEIALLDLKKVIGMAPSELLRLRGDFSDSDQPMPRAEAVKRAMVERADLVALRTAEKIASAQIEQARIEGTTDASIFGGYMRQSMGFPVRGINDAGEPAPVFGVFHFATFGVRLTLPIRNRNQGNVDAATSMLESTRRRREFAELMVQNEVASAYSRFELAREALAVYRDRVREQALQNLGVVQQTYLLGKNSLLDYLSEQRRFIDVETGYTDVLKEYVKAVIDIRRAIGEK
jgi:outer membrane protein, heavy metal efflux system